MTSYLRSWLTSGTTLAEPNPPVIVSVSESEPDEGEGSETEREDDTPAQFPSPNSAQRLTSTKPIPKFLTDDSLKMPPPPVPSLSVRNPSQPFRFPPSGLSGGLAVPTTTTTRPQKPSGKKREKVALAPGHSPLDWANLKASGEDLRGVDTLMRIPPSVLKQHRKKEDAWTAINGKVYNITPYLSFHPGGERELMRVAGRDGSQLFAATHAWVNADFMLDACMVGFLIPEPSS